MEVLATKIPGCLLLQPRPFNDARGLFVKTFHVGTFRKMGLCTDWQEEFYSVSAKGALRGLHFQIPPQEHVKMVTCLAGAVFDVVVDLRRGSPTYGDHASFRLEAAHPRALYIPPGLAHGFLALSDGALVNYKVSSMHSPEHDRGIRWDSAGIDWPEGVKVVSVRDAAFPALATFDTPFSFTEA